MSNLLVIGLLALVDKDKPKCIELIKNIIQNDFEYECITIDLNYILEHFNLNKFKNVHDSNLNDPQLLEKFKKFSGLEEILVLSSIKIMKENLIKKKLKNCVYLIEFLKSKQEADLFRQLFGLNFFLISLINTSKRSADSEFNYELSKSKFFFHSDAFLNMNDQETSSIDLKRFLDLIFGNPFVTPNKNEHHMYLAYAASLRSSSLSRQVGAVVLSIKDDVISIATNEVPRPGGGQYWNCDTSNHTLDGREFKIHKKDSNKNQIDRIILDVAKKFINDDALKNAPNDEELLEQAREKLKDSNLLNLTEYYRETHAETEALLCCARNGVKSLDATIYCTTMPCHYCIKHIVSAGIRQVFFIEPYPKSKIDLYSDSIILNKHLNGLDLNENSSESKVLFEQFVGIGPRRYFDLFSLLLGSGYNVKRKNSKGEVVDWVNQKPKLPRTPYFNLKYLFIDENLLNETNIGNFMNKKFTLSDQNNNYYNLDIQLIEFLNLIQSFIKNDCLIE